MSIVIDCGTSPCPERERGIIAATAAVRRGELVVLPTEVAYGVGADPFSVRGVTRLREAKGRGPDLPIPVLVASSRMAQGIVTDLGEPARDLMAAFWPGPLTLVARQQPTLAWGLGGDSVSVRMPLHPLALALVASTGPLAVTTANRAGSIPPRSIEAASAQMGDDVTVYLDAGPALADEPSTVVDVSGETPILLRHGAIDLDALRRCCPQLEDRA